MPNIPIGFQLTIFTWENDADHYQYQILQGLKNIEVQFYIELAQQFYSGNSGLGNKFQTNKTLLRTFHKIKQKYPTVIIRDKITLDTIYNWLTTNILGHPVEDGYYTSDDTNFCRVFDSVTVIQIPTICLDMTTQFLTEMEKVQ